MKWSDLVIQDLTELNVLLDNAPFELRGEPSVKHLQRYLGQYISEYIEYARLAGEADKTDIPLLAKGPSV